HPASCKFGYTLPCPHFSGKGDFFYFRALNQSFADNLTRTSHDIQHTGRQPCFAQDGSQSEVSKGSVACRFQNKRIPGYQSRAYLPCHNKRRHVPRNYSCTYSKRLLYGKSVSVLRDLNEIPMKTACKPAIILKYICKTRDLIFSFGKSFSLFPSKQNRKLIL